MSIFKIIAMETFDSIYGTIKKGDELNTINKENKKEAVQWAYEQYGPYGENIKHKIIEVK